jgi:hypothetical protein
MTGQTGSKREETSGAAGERRGDAGAGMPVGFAAFLRDFQARGNVGGASVGGPGTTTRIASTDRHVQQA